MSATDTLKKKTPILRALDALSGAKSLLISGHVRPDGDALGSAVALGRLLARSGNRITVCADPTHLGSPGFLKSAGPLVSPADAASGAYDLMVVLDCGALDRIPEPLQPLARNLPLLNIDHHRTNDRFGTLNWIDAAASSTSEMIWKLAKRAGWHLDRAAAEALWVGLITDTGRFAHDQTRPSTLRCGADLLKHGVRTAWINDRLYGFFSREVLELKRRAFNTLAVWRGGDVAVISLTDRDFSETGCVKADAEDVIEIPRSLAGSRVALFFYEGNPDEKVTRLSIRTRGPIEATALAQRFGGGGHARAAGCTIHAPLAEAITCVQAAVDEWLATCPSEPA
ncbi:MAG: bifunctional oligoribonuclease/PAP phosphatase NrnA [Lentisphaerota bacterium]